MRGRKKKMKTEQNKKMNTGKYNSIQLHWVHLYAKHIHMNDEECMYLWITSGLAEHFGNLFLQGKIK